MKTINHLAAVVANVLRDCKRDDIDVSEVMALASEQFAKEEDVYTQFADEVYAIKPGMGYGNNPEDGAGIDSLPSPLVNRVPNVEVIDCPPTPEGLAIIEQALAERDLPGGMYTVWVMQADRRGTMHVSAHSAASIEQAKERAITETLDDWGWSDEDEREQDVVVVGVAEGEVNLLEWDDDC